MDLNYPFLEKLHLKKILYFSPEPPPPSFQNFINDQGIHLQQLGKGFVPCVFFCPLAICEPNQRLSQTLGRSCWRRKTICFMEPHV